MARKKLVFNNIYISLTSLFKFFFYYCKKIIHVTAPMKSVKLIEKNKKLLVMIKE